MTKTAMQKKAGITSAALAKMGKNQPVTMDSLGKICQTLHCRLDDIVEYIPE
jgi:DNA-binding Xre family transcriptional regulator